jgi:hypothetical protein
MGISRRADEQGGITNASGEPEIKLELEGLTLSAMPPKPAVPRKPGAPRDGEEPDRGAIV